VARGLVRSLGWKDIIPCAFWIYPGGLEPVVLHKLHWVLLQQRECCCLHKGGHLIGPPPLLCMLKSAEVYRHDIVDQSRYLRASLGLLPRSPRLRCGYLVLGLRGLAMCSPGVVPTFCCSVESVLSSSSESESSELSETIGTGRASPFA
jgi:hypothetical protein